VSPAPLQVLTRLRTERPEISDHVRCEVCVQPIATEHQHVVHLSSRRLLCSCRPCYLLFQSEHADLAYRAVPERYLRLGAVTPQVWDNLELPVGTAFLFRNSALDQVVALYPGPAGATESALSLDAWDAVLAAVPGLALMQTDVEALLLRTGGEAFIVPIDTCYELVGHLRSLWRGFDGGQEVRAVLESFFDRVRIRSRELV
jgi:hypothetical protein